MSPLAFVLGATDHGPMILSRLDYHLVNNGGFGVGFQLLETGTFDPEEVALILSLIPLERDTIVLDIGANIGAMTLPMSRHLGDMGTVIAFEPQERIFYALAGNVALNNCWNVKVVNAAVSDKPGIMMVPRLDYQRAASYGSLELKSHTEDIGQTATEAYSVMAVSVDAMNLPKVSFIKIDVEGMELDVLNGAVETIKRYKPIILAEHIKVGYDRLCQWFQSVGYKIEKHGINIVAKT